MIKGNFYSGKIFERNFPAVFYPHFSMFKHLLHSKRKLCRLPAESSLTNERHVGQLPRGPHLKGPHGICRIFVKGSQMLKHGQRRPKCLHFKRFRGERRRLFPNSDTPCTKGKLHHQKAND